MYELSRARLFQVGPPGAWFDDVTVDFRDGAATPESTRVPARAAVLVGANGVGKTVLLDLVQSVLTPEGSTARRTQQFSVGPGRLSHVVVEYRNRAGNQVVVGMVLTGESDSSRTPTWVRRSWYVFTPTEQFSLDVPPFSTADTSFGDVARRVRATAVEGSGPRWFDTYTALHAYIHDLGFPVGLLGFREGTRNLWRRAQTSFRFVDRDLIQEVVPAGTADRLVRRVEACREAPPDGLDATGDVLRTELLEVAHEMVAAFQAVGRLPIFSGADDGPILGIDTDSVTIIQPPDAAISYLTSSPQHLDEVEEFVVGTLEQMFEGGIEITVNYRSASLRASSIHLLSARESFLVRWVLFSVLALIKSGRLAQTDGDVVGTLFIDDYVDLLDDVEWLARAFKVSGAMGFQVVLTSSSLRPALAAADVVIGVRAESTDGLRQVAVATHTRTGVWGSQPEGGADPEAEVMEHVPLTDVFDFVALNDHAIGDPAVRAGDIALSAFVLSMFAPVVVQEPRAVADDSVVVLRPVRELDQRERLFYRRFFNSEAFTTRFLGPDGIAWLRPWNLSGLQIPRPDTATLHALSELTSAARQFSQWSEEAEHAVRSYFAWDDMTVARSHMINAGSRGRPGRSRVRGVQRAARGER